MRQRQGVLQEARSFCEATGHIKPSRKAGYPRKVANLTEQPKMAKTAVIITNFHFNYFFHFIVSYAIAIPYGIYPLATISGPKLTRLALVEIGP